MPNLAPVTLLPVVSQDNCQPGQLSVRAADTRDTAVRVNLVRDYYRAVALILMSTPAGRLSLFKASMVFAVA